MAKYLVETYYNCSFKVTHYLDEVNEKELSDLEKRDDGKFEIINVKLDNRKTRSLSKNKDKNENQNEIKSINLSSQKLNENLISENSKKFVKNINDGINKRFGMPDRRKDIFKKLLSVIIKFTFILENMRMAK